ncbi:MAG: protein translocase subunit SecF [Acidobacteria bacterium]|nr:protein translocase subunit SecF [Acidobacteriota bacterium]MCL5288030.1 protein translocase subunit SecF [Acidobacteriota bacterium]
MELFRSPNIDWIGKSKWFILLSVALLALGWGSIVQKGGIRYGIDFRGGTLVYVRFAQQPPIEKLRASLRSHGLMDSSIQEVKDLARPNANEVVIGLEQKGEGDVDLGAGRAAIMEVLNSTFASAESGKQDFNAANTSSLAEFLARRDVLGLGPAAASDRYNELARSLTDFRDTERSGLVTNLADLKSAPGVDDRVLSALRDSYFTGQFAVRNVEIVGPKVGAQLRTQAMLATLYALAGMLVYIAFRFEWVYGSAAVLAVFHDVLVTLGFFSIFNFEISLTVIAALLTLVGYSMNDTIVVFDRIRENVRLMRRDSFSDIVNRSINQTLSRTILTSGLTFITVLVLLLMGGDVLRSFAFALTVGIVVGTYSSIGIAVPVVVFWYRWRGLHVAPASVSSSGGRATPADSKNRLAPAAKR